MINKINLICNKCGTPIIHGDKNCRFCGSSDFSEKEYVKKYEEVEIIGFNEPEIIDFTTDEDEVSIPTTSEPKVEEVPAPAPVPEATPITDAPLEATGVLKKIEMPKNDLSDVVTFTSQSKPEEKSLVSESTPYIVTSPSDKDKEETIEEIQKDLTEEQKDKQPEPVDFSKPESRSGHIAGIIILSFFLFLSVLANIYLTVAGTSVQDGKKEENVISDVTKSIYLGEYKMEVPNNWVSYIKDDYIVFTSSDEEWAASFSVKSSLTNNEVGKKTDAIREEFGKNKYSFTSVETVSDTVTVFKGKYNNYITDVIARTLDNDTVVVADLKYKGAVSEDVYNSVLKTIETVVKANTSTFYKNDFTFSNVSKLFGDVLVK